MSYRPDPGWRDIVADIAPRFTGVGAPTVTTYAGGNVSEWAFGANDYVSFDINIPHDYIPGTDIYFNVHWSHNGTAISGDAEFTLYAQYAKGHNQSNFGSEITATVSYATVDVTTTPQYRHRMEEIQLSTSGGSASKVDTDLLEPNGVLLCLLKLTSLPSITAGDLFIHEGSLHYRSSSIGTKNREPDFYT